MMSRTTFLHVFKSEMTTYIHPPLGLVTKLTLYSIRLCSHILFYLLALILLLDILGLAYIHLLGSLATDQSCLK